MVEHSLWERDAVGSNPIIPTSSLQEGHPVTVSMKINLWYCKSMGQWRWTLTTEDTDSHLTMESGQRPFLREAMNDVANTVEYLLDKKQ